MTPKSTYKQIFLSRLKSTGVNVHELETLLGLKQGDIHVALTKPDTHKTITKKIDKALNNLESEQYDLVSNVTNMLFSQGEELARTFVFMPCFPTISSYSRAGYIEKYGSYSRFCADCNALFESIKLINPNIYFFTPMSTNYEEKKVFKGYPKETPKILIDPFRVKRDLGVKTGRHVVFGEDSREMLIKNNRDRIIAIVKDEIEMYKKTHKGALPKEVLLPTYLSRSEFEKKAPKNLNLFIFNTAVVRALTVLNETFFNTHFNLCTPEALTYPFADTLTIDLLKGYHDTK